MAVLKLADFDDYPYPKSKAMSDFLALLNKVVLENIPVLFVGESGVGKEFFAKYIFHRASDMFKRFYHVNCLAIPESIEELDIFEPDFLGVSPTVYLDEVFELNEILQKKLLRFFKKVGINNESKDDDSKIEYRLISSSTTTYNENFLRELYDQITGIVLHIPPLRERKEDISGLVDYFTSKYLEQKKIRTKKSLSYDLVELMAEYDWPGNLNELNNFVISCMVVSDEEVINLKNIPKDLLRKLNPDEPIAIQTEITLTNFSIENTEKEVIVTSLKNNGYNLSATAKEVGLSRSTLYRKIKKYDIKIAA